MHIYITLLLQGKTLKNPFLEAFKVAAKTAVPVVLRFESKQDSEIRNKIRNHNLRWNTIRQERCGMVTDLESLKASLDGIKYDIEILPTIQY